MAEGIIGFVLHPGEGIVYHRLENIGKYGSINDVQMNLPEGVYTTFRTYQKTKVLNLEAHLNRLEESAALLGRPLVLNRAVIRGALRSILQESYFSENRVRMSADLNDQPGDLYIVVEELRPPAPEEYQNGARAGIYQMQRENPKAKSTDFIARSAEVKAKIDGRLNEIIMIGEDGRMLEGLSSNFFAVSRGAVWTADQEVLSGMTRELILQLLQEAGIPVHMQGFFWGNIDQADEAFITSASRGVLPIVEIDHRTIGSGRPGPLTVQLMRDFEQRVAEMAEPV